ncbi:hypothetical protein BuS5_01053 [Desulfosarcina sp. BuS5]|nr:hypothetical protein BuS5_01053 [Desulfosarcina sp. BuS5]
MVHVIKGTVAAQKNTLLRLNNVWIVAKKSSTKYCLVFSTKEIRMLIKWKHQFSSN